VSKLGFLSLPFAAQGAQNCWRRFYNLCYMLCRLDFRALEIQYFATTFCLRLCWVEQYLFVQLWWSKQSLVLLVLSFFQSKDESLFHTSHLYRFVWVTFVFLMARDSLFLNLCFPNLITVVLMKNIDIKLFMSCKQDVLVRFCYQYGFIR